MTKYQEPLLMEIEKKRNELHNLSKNKKRTDKKVIALSQELDLLLNYFNEKKTKMKVQ